MYKIIGLSGKIGNGKTFLANDIVRKYPHVKIVSFATELKKCAAIVGGYDVDDSYTQEGKNKVIPWLGITIREFLQKFGTDAMRKGVDINFWVKKLQSTLRPGNTYLIDDMRFPNEYDFSASNGIVARVVRLQPMWAWNKTYGMPITDVVDLSQELLGDKYMGVHAYTHYQEKNREYMNKPQLRILNSLSHASETALDKFKFNEHVYNFTDNSKLVYKEIETFINK